MASKLRTLLTVTMMCVGIRGANARPVNPNTDSVEAAGVSLFPPPLNRQKAYVSGAKINLSLVAVFESDGVLLGLASATGVTWMANNGGIVGDTYTAPVTGTPITATITGVYFSEVFDFFSDKATGMRDISVVPNSSAAAPPPVAPVFGAPPPGLAIVSVTLTNPFSQVLAVDADSTSVPGSGTSGLGDTTVFDPFANVLQSARFAIQPNSSITAELGLGFVSGNTFDQDGAISLSGTLADGTPVATPILRFDLIGGPTAVVGTFAAVPEPPPFILILAGLSTRAIFAGARSLLHRRKVGGNWCQSLGRCAA